MSILIWGELKITDFWAALYCCLGEIFLKLSSVHGKISLFPLGGGWFKLEREVCLVFTKRFFKSSIDG